MPHPDPLPSDRPEESSPSDGPSEWSDAEHALAYLARADDFPHRLEGDGVVLELLPAGARRILDLGTGDGRLLALARTACPDATGVAIDNSPIMLEKARARFAGVDEVTIVDHDLARPLPDLGSFDLILSSFAIHHLDDERKFSLYQEIFRLLEPGGLFCNLEHVASPTPELHREFYIALGTDPDEEEDPSDQLVSVERQLEWLREIGFEQVDCFWKWREMALLAGIRGA